MGELLSAFSSTDSDGRVRRPPWLCKLGVQQLGIPAETGKQQVEDKFGLEDLVLKTRQFSPSQPLPGRTAVVFGNYPLYVYF